MKRQDIGSQGESSNVEKHGKTQNLDDIVADTPRTTLAATRWKRVLSRAGPVVIDAFREILIDVVSETAKRILWP